MSLENKSLTAIVSSQLTVELIEELQGTSMYKQNIKNLGNRFINALEPNLRQYANVYQVDQELAMNMSKEMETLIKKIAKCDVREITMINQIHDYYKEHQEEWDDLFDVELTKINS